MKLHSFFFALVTFISFAPTTNAEIVYNFETGTGAGTSSDPSIAIGFIGASAGVANVGFNGPGNPGAAMRGSGFEVGSSPADSDSFFFLVSVPSDVILELTSISFDEYAEEVAIFGVQGPETWQIRIDGVDYGSPQTTYKNTYGATHVVDLQSAQFTNQFIQVSIHGWGADPGIITGTSEWFIDNVTLNFNTFAVPEPTSTMLLSMVLIPGVWLRRRRQRVAQRDSEVS